MASYLEGLTPEQAKQFGAFRTFAEGWEAGQEAGQRDARKVITVVVIIFVIVVFLVLISS
jgi:hypothetical protein